MTPNSQNGHEERSLVQRAMSGDADAFGMLYVRYMDPIYRYIFFRIGDEPDAEDLTEEVFIRAWESLSNYRLGEHPFKSWLYKIAHNLVIDHHRRRKISGKVDLDLLADSALSHEDVLMDQQTTLMLAQALQFLSDEEQQVVVLRFVEGHSHEEVASVIGKSVGACRVIQYRALAALQAILAKQMHTS